MRNQIAWLGALAALALGCGATESARRPARPTPPAPRPQGQRVETQVPEKAPPATGGPAEPAKPEPPAKPELITLVVAGDVGLNRNGVPVDPRGVKEGGGVLPWSDMSDKIRGLIDGDLNFLNLETVVSDRDDLAPGDKGQKHPYLFKSHPAGVAHLADIGFNLFSLANNHAYDFGAEGVRETIKHLSALAEREPIHFSGVGLDRESVATPATFSVRGARVAFSAIGIVTNMLKAHRAGKDKPGSLAYRYDEDWQLCTRNLGATPADLRILSVHFGYERHDGSEPKQLADFRAASEKQDVAVVVGHHAHVVRGVELHRGRVIFYGLGNFMIRGARDMGSDPRLAVWGDFGLLARVYLVLEDGEYRPAAVVAVPIWDMHRAPHPLSDPAESRKRIEVLNVLATGLDDEKAGSVGMRFRPRADGTGLWCAEGAAEGPKKLAELCEGWKPAGPPPADVARIVGSQMRRH